MRSIIEADLKNKRVLMRAGFDVAVDDEGNITEDRRIKEGFDTIKYILEQKPNSLIIISHLDRPEGKVVEKLKLNKVASTLAGLIKKAMSVVEIDPEILELLNINKEIEEENSPIEIPWYKIGRNLYLLENIRFYPEEEKNTPEFAKKLAGLGEVFVFEAFSAAHREQASVTGIMDYLPSFAGIEMEKEVSELSKLTGEVDHPFVVIIGGAKTEDKAPVIDNLLNKADKILVGGRTSNLLHQEGEYKDEPKLVLHLDGIDANNKVIKAVERPLAALDIGPETIKLFRQEIVKARTILVAGPLGKIEEAAYQKGSREVFFTAGYSNAYKVACGGDTIEALNKFGLYNNFDFVSTGGGAALEFLANGTLPVIDKLNKNHDS